MSDVWEYITACFWSALAFRQTTRAATSFVVGLLALPLLWLLGGTIEFTERGLWWAAAWFTVTSIVLLFVVGPYFLWREYRQATIPTLSVDPITFVELAQIAKKDRGWNFASRWETVDFEHGIRQACNAGILVMDAKPNPDHISKGYKDQYLPVEIPRDAWRERNLAIAVDASVVLDETDNWDVLVVSWGLHTERNQYRDPQLTKRTDAIEWLKRHGPRFRGNSEKADKEAKERRRLREATEANVKDQ